MEVLAGMMRVEIGIKMERLAEVLVRSPNRLEDIRDMCLEIATDIDQYLQEVEEGAYDNYHEDDDDEEDDDDDEPYNLEEDERYQEYKYRFGGDDDDEY
jgi:hypothetical protein